MKYLPSSPTIQRKERTDSQKLTFDLKIHAVAHIQTHTKHIKHNFKEAENTTHPQPHPKAACSWEVLAMMFSSFSFGYRPEEDSGNERLLFKGNCLGECQSNLTEVPARCSVLAGNTTADALLWGVEPPCTGLSWGEAAWR